MKKLAGIFILFLLHTALKNVDPIYTVTRGRIDLLSYAPLEIIKAYSEEVKGAINTQENTFAFTVNNISFKGFNSDLQREHFNDNYMESGKYPRSSFSGKIIEKIDYFNDGIHEVRAKGKLLVHGIEQERIIKAKLEIKKGRFLLYSKFTVLLQDHNIVIPKIVFQKIAEEIEVELKAELVQK